MKHLLLLSFILFNLSFIQAETKIAKLVKQEEVKSFKAEQFIGKWYLWARSESKKSKFDTAAEGKFLALKQDGTYTADALDKSKAGKWSYNKKNNTLVLEHKDSKTTYEVSNVNEFGLVLINQATKEKWVFALEG